MNSKRSRIFHKTKLGKIILGDSLEIMKKQKENSVDLIMTSPPFGLITKKDYGNVDADDYLEWFSPFAENFYRVLKETGSLVIDIGGTWNKGKPTRHLYHFELLIMLCKEFGFHLAQDFYWWNPAKLPTPAPWVTVERVRVKDAVNTIWWLSKGESPKASNEKVLQPYSPSMLNLLENGYSPKVRPSGHRISNKFQVDNGAAIPPNLIAISNTDNNNSYFHFCKEIGVKPHPARFPSQIPEFFVRLLTDQNDLVIDPFAGSCVTGEVCEYNRRKWICVDLVEDYLKGGVGRFKKPASKKNLNREKFTVEDPSNFYQIPKLGVLWNTQIYNDELHQYNLSLDESLPLSSKSRNKKSEN